MGLPMTGKALIIGYGNPLRGDDGIGQAAAQALANDAAIECADVIGCHQLTPELAECIAAVDLVVFVDAAADIQPGVVVVREIQGTSTQSSGLVHAADPAALLDLTRKLYGRTPNAFLVTIGGSTFALSEELSEAASAALPEAIATVCRLVSERLENG
jgi:hydrogenase maturation protease